MGLDQAALAKRLPRAYRSSVPAPVRSRPGAWTGYPEVAHLHVPPPDPEAPVEEIEPPEEIQPPEPALSSSRAEVLALEGRGSKGNRQFRTTMLSEAARHLPAGPFKLLAYLASRGDSDGGNCFPSNKTIEKEALDRSRCSRQRWMAHLVEQGWVEAIPFLGANGRQTSNLYRFRIPARLAKNGGKEGALRWDNRPPWDVPEWRAK